MPARSISTRALAVWITFRPTQRFSCLRRSSGVVWEYFSRRAEQKGNGIPQLPTDVLKDDIVIGEALK
jgi:hypothetical protein